MEVGRASRETKSAGDDYDGSSRLDIFLEIESAITSDGSGLRDALCCWYKLDSGRGPATPIRIPLSKSNRSS